MTKTTASYEELRTSWEMWVDTEIGNVKLFTRAENREEAIKKFRNYVKSTDFHDKYGNLYDFKEHTIK